MGVMLEDEIRLATLRERLEDRPNNKNVTVQLGEIPTKTLLRPMPSNSNMYRVFTKIEAVASTTQA